MKRVALPEAAAETLFGNRDENLRFLEDNLKVRIKNDGADPRRGRQRGGPGSGGPGLRPARVDDQGRLRRLPRRRARGRPAPEPGSRGAPARLPDEGGDSRGQEGGGAAQPQPARVPRRARQERHGVRDRPGGDREVHRCGFPGADVGRDDRDRSARLRHHEGPGRARVARHPRSRRTRDRDPRVRRRGIGHPADQDAARVFDRSHARTSVARPDRKRGARLAARGPAPERRRASLCSADSGCSAIRLA